MAAAALVTGVFLRLWRCDEDLDKVGSPEDRVSQPPDATLLPLPGAVLLGVGGAPGACCDARRSEDAVIYSVVHRYCNSSCSSNTII